MFTPAYAFAQNDATLTLIVLGGTVPFDSPGLMAGVTFDGTDTFTVDETGVYRVTFIAQTVGVGGVLGSVAIAVDGTPINTGPTLVELGAPLILDQLVALTAGSDVTIEVTSALGLSIAPGDANANIVIERVA